MDRATFSLLQTPFMRVDNEVQATPEALRREWLNLMDNVLQLLQTPVGSSAAFKFLQHVRGQFDLRTAPAGLVWTAQSLRPISTPNLNIFVEQIDSIISNTPALIPQLTLAIAGQWLFEFKYIFALYPPPPNDLPGFPVDPVRDLAIAAEVANYAAFRNDGQELESRISTALERNRAEFDTLMLEGQQGINKLNQNIIELQTKDEELRSKIASYQETLDDQSKRARAAEVILSDMGERLRATEENYTSFAKAIERKYAMSATREYWNSQARSAGLAFWISVAIVVLLLIGGASVLIIWHAGILATLQDILVTPDNLKPNMTLAQLAVTSINRLILIVLPLALVIWFARLLVRYMTRSLALADDARLRQAMMDTFLRLDVDSDLSKEERNVMLSALYRPGPGQAPDLPDFPNVIELINKIGTK